MSRLNEYETICILVPEAQGDALKTVEDRIKKIFTAHKVKEVSKKDWGLRKLAYPVKKYRHARYFQFNYQAPPTLVADLEKNLGYEEPVLKFLTMRLEKHTPRNVVVEPAGFEPIE